MQKRAPGGFSVEQVAQAAMWIVLRYAADSATVRFDCRPSS
jgi:hypothetical protein